jgi:hypothetical protein
MESSAKIRGRMLSFSYWYWAHLRRFTPQTGLSAPIPRACFASPAGFPLQSLARFGCRKPPKQNPKSGLRKFAVAVFVLCFSGCALFFPEALALDPLVLEEITPLPRSVVVNHAPEYEPVYSVMRIVEVSEVNGVQKFFLVRAVSPGPHIREGVKGEIAGDEEFKKVIGSFTIVEVYGDFFRCEARQLDYKIGVNAYIRIQTGEKTKR